MLEHMKPDSIQRRCQLFRIEKPVFDEKAVLHEEVCFCRGHDCARHRQIRHLENAAQPLLLTLLC